MLANPPTMIAINSESVAPEMNGLTRSGASVWPRKMLAAAESVSAPEVRIDRCMTHARPRPARLPDSEGDQDEDPQPEERLRLLRRRAVRRSPRVVQEVRVCRAAHRRLRHRRRDKQKGEEDDGEDHPVGRRANGAGRRSV